LSSLILLKSRELTTWLDEKDTLDLLLDYKIRLGDQATFALVVFDFAKRLDDGYETISRPQYVPGADPVNVSLPLSPSLLQRAFISQLAAQQLRSQTRVP